jgi:tetratricopeptide (TPR) repeat protein
MALVNALEALERRQMYPLEKASTLDLLGCIYLAMRGQEAAHNNFKDALQIRLKYLRETNPNHPDIGLSYQNLGKTDTKLSHFIDAQDNYSEAAKIYRHNYPETHPLVIEITKCLEQVRRRV